MNAGKISEEELWDYYYHAMELLSEGNLPQTENILEKILILDPAFVATHVGMVALYEESGDKEAVREFTESGYAETRIHFSNKWPEDMSWDVTENRQYLRAILYKAALHHIDGEKEEADKLYRLLLNFTPRDNQGVRYLIAGMYSGIAPDEVDKMFEEGNDKQDWSALKNMLDEQNAKHHFWKYTES